MNTHKIFTPILLALLIAVPAWGSENSEPDSGAGKFLKLMQDEKVSEANKLNLLSRMVLIPAGEFAMGSDIKPDESPVRKVYVNDFYMDQYEVTQLAYLSATGTNPSYFNKCSLCPVEKVTFEQAGAYCKKMNKRLPTEAEWEKAARAGTTTAYYWGNNWHNYYAWYGNNSDQTTQPVGQKEPNALRLHDMAGNVAEWVNDWYDAEIYRTGPQKNPEGPAKGTLKIIRGGSWGHPPEFIRHAIREPKDPGTGFINVGFRCAADSP